MKGRIGILFLVCAVLLSFFSCSAPESPVVGRWEIQIEDDEMGKVQMVYHFTREGEVKLEQQEGDRIPFSIPFGTYKTQGKTLTLESEGAGQVYTFSVEENTLTLSAEGEEDLVFQRIG